MGKIHECGCVETMGVAVCCAKHKYKGVPKTQELDLSEFVRDGDTDNVIDTISGESLETAWDMLQVIRLLLEDKRPSGLYRGHNCSCD